MNEMYLINYLLFFFFNLFIFLIESKKKKKVKQLFSKELLKFSFMSVTVTLQKWLTIARFLLEQYLNVQFYNEAIIHPGSFKEGNLSSFE